jgi:uncharacterized protein YbaR (Trm112 family)
MAEQKHREGVAVRCFKCEHFVSATVEGEFPMDRHPDYDRDISRYVLLCCPDCNSPLLAQQEGSHEQIAYGEGADCYATPIVLYPGAPVLRGVIPPNIGATFLEAHRCYTDAAAYTACAILCRRTLEGICADFGATKGNLQSKLETLKSNGIIDGRIHEWADGLLRDLGNDAAHEIDTVISKADAEHALEFTKAILEYIYVLGVAYKLFKERRRVEKRTEGPSTETNEA